jgi:hypothetical protein
MATVQRKTPGVYISEPSSFPPAIVGVETAVPAFIGYTETARYKGEGLILRPTKISSMADYVSRFGGGFPEHYFLLPAATAADESDYVVVDKFTLFEGGEVFQLVESGDVNFFLYNSLRLFYENGGGDCWIVSCNSYDAGGVKRGDLQGGLDAIENVVGPTMLVVPDAVLLKDVADFNMITQNMLRQCLEKQDRVAILDVWGAWNVPKTADVRAAIQQFRDGLNGAPPESLRYGIAYFPNLKTSIVAAEDLNITNFVGPKGTDTLRTALNAAVDRLYPASDPRHDKVAGYVAMIGDTLADDDEIRKTPPVNRTPPGMLTHSELTTALLANIPGLRNMFYHAAASQNTLPPSAAMAGVYTTTDTTRGVWNAPANVGIAALIEPTYEVTNKQQEDLNVPPGGKAVNAIRTFPTRGSLVWGARTLDSNSNDWRYIQVRRTMIYVEQSVKTALNAFVFAPNTASTWTTVTSMIESFLHGLWSSGGLMGASPGEAYSVRCGLGSTMTADDILNGYMIVHIVLQMVHPAEFIELVFKQQMLGGGA